MSSTNQYRDTRPEDYLNDVRTYIAQQKAKSISATDSTLTYILPIRSQGSITTPVPTATEYTLGNYDVVDNTSKQLAYFPFDYSLEDASNSHDCTVTAGTETYAVGETISYTHPQRYAFSFDGSTYLTVPTESDFDFQHSNAFSVSCRVKIASDSVNQGLVCKSTDLVTASGWKIFYDTSGKILFKLSTGTTPYSVSSGPVYKNIPFHICATFSGNSNTSGMKLYLDGVNLAQTSGAGMFNRVMVNDTIFNEQSTGTTISSSILNSEPVVIGAESDGGSKIQSGGWIDDVQIWNVELTSAQVLRLFYGQQVNRDTTATNPAYLGVSDVA